MIKRILLAFCIAVFVAASTGQLRSQGQDYGYGQGQHVQNNKLSGPNITSEVASNIQDAIDRGFQKYGNDIRMNAKHISYTLNQKYKGFWNVIIVQTKQKKLFKDYIGFSPNSYYLQWWAFWTQVNPHMKNWTYLIVKDRPAKDTKSRQVASTNLDYHWDFQLTHKVSIWLNSVIEEARELSSDLKQNSKYIQKKLYGQIAYANWNVLVTTYDESFFAVYPLYYKGNLYIKGDITPSGIRVLIYSC